MRGRAIQRDKPQYEVKTVSSVYANVNTEKGQDWYRFDSLSIDFGDINSYEIGPYIGTGKYSDVFIGYRDTEQVALKIMKPVRPEKYKREIKILQNLKPGPNIVKILDILKNPETEQYILVFEYVEGCDFHRVFPTLTDMDTRIYFFQLLRALQYAHSNGIMHRDVKPHNVIFNTKTKKLTLIDWGLAEFYHPGTNYNIHVASRHFKPIELLVDYQLYDYSLDMWGFGVTLLGALFNKTPFFKGVDDYDMVHKIVGLLGRRDFDAYLKKYGITIPDTLKKKLPSNQERFNFRAVPDSDRHVPPEALDLVDKCLRYDHQERITAADALNHRYFDPVRTMRLPT